jgi:hypothetical protein
MRPPTGKRLQSLQRAEVFWDVNRVLLQHRQVDHLKSSGVGGSQHHRRSYACLICLTPAFSKYAPAVTRLQAGKAVLRHWSDQVIADTALMIKKLSCDDRAHQMARLRWPRAAAAVAIETGDWIGTTGLQFGTEDIRFAIHSSSVAKGCALSLSEVAGAPSAELPDLSDSGSACHDRDRGAP